jgi:hypothetical protein
VARIRTIKPDFWTDGNIVKLSPFARLLYIGMWNFTLCDFGHVADDAFKLKLQVLPSDNVDVDSLLAELMSGGRVRRVEDPDGRTYLHVKRFEDHQKIDPRWKTRCPACAHKDSLKPTETPVSFVEPQRDSPELPLGRDGMGRDGKGIEETCAPAAPETRSTDYPPAFEAFWSHYPKKSGKRQALNAWRKASKRATQDELIAGADRYRDDPNRNPGFTKNAEGWLNGDGWLDEPLPVRGQARQMTAREQSFLDLERMKDNPNPEVLRRAGLEPPQPQFRAIQGGAQ